MRALAQNMLRRGLIFSCSRAERLDVFLNGLGTFTSLIAGYCNEAFGSTRGMFVTGGKETNGDWGRERLPPKSYP